jgi:hypothetical protein
MVVVVVELLLGMVVKVGRGRSVAHRRLRLRRRIGGELYGLGLGPGPPHVGLLRLGWRLRRLGDVERLLLVFAAGGWLWRCGDVERGGVFATALSSSCETVGADSRGRIHHILDLCLLQGETLDIGLEFVEGVAHPRDI